MKEIQTNYFKKFDYFVKKSEKVTSKRSNTMDTSSNSSMQYYNICLQIFGPLNKNGDQSDLMPGVTMLSLIGVDSKELEFSKENGKMIIDKYSTINTNQFKSTHNTEKHNIIELFNPYVKDEQPIASGIYMIHNIALYDLSHMDMYYNKPITFFVECKNNSLEILDNLDIINFI